MVGGKEEGATALYLGPPKTESGKRVVYTNDQAVLGFNRIETYQKRWALPAGRICVCKSERKSLRAQSL